MSQRCRWIGTYQFSNPLAGYPTIIRTNDGRLFAVRDFAAGDHAALGIAVKKTRDGYAPKAGAREQMVRVAAALIVAEPSGRDNTSSHDQSRAPSCA